MMKEQDRDLPNRIPPAEDVEHTPREAFYRAHPPAAFADAVAARRRRALSWLPAAGLAAAGAVAAVLLLVPWAGRETVPRSQRPSAVQRPAAEDAAFGAAGAHRRKSTLRPGGAREAAPVDLAVVVLRRGRSEPVEDGAPLTPDSRIRFLYDSPEYDYLMLVSVFGAGKLSVLYPLSEGPSIQVVRGRGIPLHGAVQLDAHVGPERFFALFSPAPLAFDQVEAAVAASRPPPAGVDDDARHPEQQRLPQGSAQATLLIEKELAGGVDDG